MLQLFKKEKHLIVVTGFSAILTALVFLPQNLRSGGLITFHPFWFIHSMLDFSDRVGWLRLSQARSAYFERGEYVKYALAEGLGLFLFIAGNLGVRVIGFLGYFKTIRNSENLLLLIFMGIIFGLSLLIPTLFIQKGNPWNTIQFFYYGLYIAALFSGAGIVYFVKLLPKILIIPSVLFLIFITPVNAVTTFRSALYPLPPSRISQSELEALKFLESQSDGTVLTYPYDKNLRARSKEPFRLMVYETTSYVSAMSNKSVYMEDEFQQDIFQLDYKKRIVESLDFFLRKDLEWSTNFLRERGISYIYLPKIYPVALDPDKLNLKVIFENEEVIIYQRG